IMVYLVDAENETVSNIFTYGPHTLVLCDNSSATLLNTSSDFHGMGPMFDVLNNSDVVAVNALRSANESLRCDETSDFKLINRISISRFNEPSFDSADGNVDEVEYTVTDKTMINDGSVKVGSTTLYTGSKYSKTDATSLYHAASPSDAIDATLYSQSFAPINVDPYMTEDGYLHMWVYVEDMTTSIWTGEIRLKGTYGSLMWSNICYITHNGWNELWLPLTGAKGTVSGTVNSLSITDKRSVKKEHSDFYFDDIYLCIAESDDADANETVDAYEVAPVPELNIPALPPAITEDGKITLISCDSLYNNKARSTLAYVIGDPEFVKEGTGSWKMSRFGHLSYEVTFGSVNLSKYMKNGYLHLWIYAENAGTLDGAFELTSSGKCDKQEISWHAKKHLIKNGWNELLLPLSKPDSSTGDFAPRSANYFRFYLTSSGNVTIYIDDVSIIGGSTEDLGPEEITEDSETFSFTVGAGEEGMYLENANSHLNNSVRFADGTSAFAYVYHVRDFSKLQAVRWDATTSGQMKVSVSTDGKSWTDVYTYVGEATDSGLAKASRTYNLTDFITEKRATSGEIYVKISDAYPETGFGGAVAIEAPVEMTLYYVPVDTSEWESEQSGGGSTPDTPSTPDEPDIPDVLPATETHVFHANQPAELSYLTGNNTSSVLGGNRFSDAQRSFTYGYVIYDFSRVKELTWTATVGQQLHILVSTDNVNFTDVYRYTNEEERGIAFEQRTYDLLPLIDRATSSTKLYIKIADSQTENGWGGAIRCDAPITLKVAYEGGEGDVLKGEGAEPDEPENVKDPDGKLHADTPRPDGKVDRKLMIHACETLDGARVDWVPVYLNTNPAFVKEGSASIKRQNAMDLQWFALQFEATDISDFMENGYLHLWVYVTDYNLSSVNGQIEISSSGYADTNELHWNVADYIIGTGWNEVFVPLSQGIENQADAPFDPTQLKFIRIFVPTTDGKYNTVYIDDIYFCTMK
ncbi:MAG: hypothetical protein IIX15_01840, partial [Clostridia bacterium]|nr:hypothetical protein [Clostridia bacterium]